MSEPSRTLITEDFKISDDLKSPMKTTYSITRNRLVSYGGVVSHAIEARVLDGHFLLTRVNVCRGFSHELFGIVSLDQPKIALERMYEEAKRLAKVIAESDRNKVLDITSRSKKVSGDEIYFVPREYLNRFS